LESYPADAFWLLIQLERWASTPNLSDPDALEAAFAGLNGKSLSSALHDAVQDGRLAAGDVQEMLGLLARERVPSEDGPTVSLSGVAQRLEAERYARLLSEAHDRDDPEQALSLLRALNRDMRQLWSVGAAWQRQGFRLTMGQSLAQRWPQYMVRSMHALGLAHEAPAPMAQIEEWYERLSETTFRHPRLGKLLVTGDYPEDGCYLRAHIWAAELMRWGLLPRKAVAQSGAHQGLSIFSDYARNATRAWPGRVNWTYHVAPVVSAMDPHDGTPVPMVLDPALHLGPLTVLQWAKAVGMPTEPGSYYYDDGPFHDVRRRFNQTVPEQPSLLLTDGFVLGHVNNFQPGTWQGLEEYVADREPKLYRHHVRAERRKLARLLSQVLHRAQDPDGDGASIPEELTNVVSSFGPLPGLLEGFPDLATKAQALLKTNEWKTFTSYLPPLHNPFIQPDEDSDTETYWDDRNVLPPRALKPSRGLSVRNSTSLPQTATSGRARPSGPRPLTTRFGGGAARRTLDSANTPSHDGFSQGKPAHAPEAVRLEAHRLGPAPAETAVSAEAAVSTQTDTVWRDTAAPMRLGTATDRDSAPSAGTEREPRDADEANQTAVWHERLHPDAVSNGPVNDAGEPASARRAGKHREEAAPPQPWETPYWAGELRAARANGERVENLGTATRFVAAATGRTQVDVNAASPSGRHDVMLTAMVDLVAHEIDVRGEQAGENLATDLVGYFAPIEPAPVRTGGTATRMSTTFVGPATDGADRPAAMPQGASVRHEADDRPASGRAGNAAEAPSLASAESLAEKWRARLSPAGFDTTRQSVLSTGELIKHADDIAQTAITQLRGRSSQAHDQVADLTTRFSLSPDEAADLALCVVLLSDLIGR
jgi:hypothetical protein